MYIVMLRYGWWFYEYDIRVKLCAWTMVLLQKSQKIFNKSNSMPLSSIRPYDITSIRLQLLHDTYFDFKPQYCYTYHHDLYQKQKMQKRNYKILWTAKTLQIYKNVNHESLIGVLQIVIVVALHQYWKGGLLLLLKVFLIRRAVIHN